LSHSIRLPTRISVARTLAIIVPVNQENAHLTIKSSR
jgi:hypothetical protein